MYSRSSFDRGRSKKNVFILHSCKCGVFPLATVYSEHHKDGESLEDSQFKFQ